MPLLNWLSFTQPKRPYATLTGGILDGTLGTSAILHANAQIEYSFPSTIRERIGTDPVPPFDLPNDGELAHI